MNELTPQLINFTFNPNHPKGVIVGVQEQIRQYENLRPPGTMIGFANNKYCQYVSIGILTPIALIKQNAN